MKQVEKVKQSHILYSEVCMFCFVGFLVIGGFLFFNKLFEVSIGLFFLAGASLGAGGAMYFLMDRNIINTKKLEETRKQKASLEKKLEHAIRREKKENRRNYDY